MLLQIPRATLLCVMLGVAPAFADGAVDRKGSPRANQPSIHARELQHWNQQPSRDWQTDDPTQAKARRHLPQTTATQSHHILGFHPYWMGTRYLAYDWSTLHTVVFFSLEISATGQILNDHGWPWNDLVSTAHNNGANILVAATQFSSSDLSTLLGSATNRSAAIANIVNAMVAGNADGVCLDFEAIPGSRKQQYVDFADELRAALDITQPQSMLVITTPAVDWNNAYDYDELAAPSNYLVLMAYDYHWSGSSTSGPVAPLSGWGTYNVEWSIQDHMTWGAPANKLLLGVPYYGYRWDTVTNQPAATTTSTGTALIYSTVQSVIPQHIENWDATSETPWLQTSSVPWQQTWFEDAASLTAKYNTVHTEGLGGIGIWALGYDDLYTDLWNTLHTSFDQVTSHTDPAGRSYSLQVVSPNPFATQVTLAELYATESVHRSTELLIYDVRGRRVRRLPPTNTPQGIRFIWDGRTAQGNAAAQGVYWATARPMRSSEVRGLGPPSIRLIKVR